MEIPDKNSNETLPKEGYLFVAMGEQFVAEATHAALRIRAIDTLAHITIACTHEPKSTTAFDQILIHPAQTGEIGFMYKARQLATIMPYERTFFMDSDTYMVAPCRELFALLDYCDMCMAHCPVDFYKIYNKDSQLVAGCYAYNSGVVVYQRNTRAVALLQSWFMTYQKHRSLYPGDQNAFMEAYLYSDVKICVLQSIYNFRTPYVHSAMGLPVKIIHGRVKDYAQTARQLNKFPDKDRVWIPQSRSVIYRNAHIWFRLYMAAPAFVHEFFRRLYFRFKK